MYLYLPVLDILRSLDFANDLHSGSAKCQWLLWDLIGDTKPLISLYIVVCHYICHDGPNGYQPARTRILVRNHHLRLGVSQFLYHGDHFPIEMDKNGNLISLKSNIKTLLGSIHRLRTAVYLSEKGGTPHHAIPPSRCNPQYERNQKRTQTSRPGEDWDSWKKFFKPPVGST
jgi:hypothetical protein